MLDYLSRKTARLLTLEACPPDYAMSQVYISRICGVFPFERVFVR